MKYVRNSLPSIRTLCILTMLILSLFLFNLGADTDTRIKEIQDRLEELANEAAQNSDNMERMNDIVKEMQSLSQELQQLAGTGESGTGNFSKEEQAAADAAAKSAPSGHEDDPCYNCKYRKEYANALFGSTLPWVHCVPMYFYLTWKVDETYHRHSGFPEDRLIYTLEEQYPGCLHLVYDQKTLSTVESFLICGPLPQKNSVVASGLTKVSAHLLAEMAGLLKSRYKSGRVTIADIGYGTLYDTNAWAMKNPVNSHFSGVTGQKGTSIGGTVDNNRVRLYWENPVPPPCRSLEAMFKLPCKPMPDCRQWGSIEYVSDEFLDRAGDHYLKLIHGWTSPLQKPFIIERPGDKLCWLRYNYTLRKVCPK